MVGKDEADVFDVKDVVVSVLTEVVTEVSVIAEFLGTFITCVIFKVIIEDCRPDTGVGVDVVGFAVAF